VYIGWRDRFLGSLNVYKFGLWLVCLWYCKWHKNMETEIYLKQFCWQLWTALPGLCLAASLLLFHHEIFIHSKKRIYSFFLISL
jgi:hypothetical protein